MSFVCEILKAVPGYEGRYEVSNLGYVRSISRYTGHQNIRGRKLKGFHNNAGYLHVNLWISNVSHKDSVHRLVCTAFNGTTEIQRPEVNHKDGNKNNNAASNLEWITRKENQLHAADLNLKPHGESSHLAKLTLDQVVEIRGLKGTAPQKTIGAAFGVSQTCISKIFRNQKWRNN